MSKVENEIKRLQEKIRSAKGLIVELERKSDKWSQDELRRQKQEVSGLEAEIASLRAGG
jgi:peptidoglycan hydrolase CwlO-like protein